MKKKYDSRWAKVGFIVLFSFGLGILIYVYGMENTSFGNSKKLKSANKEFDSRKPADNSAQKNILDSLTTLKLAYDVALEEKSSLSLQLEAEKKNVENLMEIIKASKNPSASEIEVYRRQFSNLKTSLSSKVSEINSLKSQNKNLLTEIENQNVAMYKQQQVNDTLISNQKKLETTLKDASRLSLNNFKVIALKENHSGKESETAKAKNAKKLKISFSVLENSIAKTGKKIYYVQVLDQRNKVLGEDKLIEFGNDKALVYSFVIAVDFQGKAVSTYGILNPDGVPFQKGTYFVNFFDKQDIVGSSSITLE